MWRKFLTHDCVINWVACVGIIVLVGCFTLVIAPDDLLKYSPPEAERSVPTVVIDPGHGGNDEGARCRGVLEKNLTLNIALRVEEALQKRGFPTLLTRTEDRYVSLPQRVAVVNALEGPAVFVSIHFNKDAGSRTSGIETFFALNKALTANEWTWVGIFSQSPQNGACEDLAAKIQAAVVAKTGARNRGALARDLYVIRHARVPAILIEGGFISSKEEKVLLSKDEYADQLAEGIADGVKAWHSSRRQSFSGPLAEAH